MTTSCMQGETHPDWSSSLVLCAPQLRFREKLTAAVWWCVPSLIWLVPILRWTPWP